MLILALAAAFHYRQTGWDVTRLGYKFGRLYFKKELVARLEVHGSQVYVYAEKVNGRHLKILDLENLGPILKKSFNDYEVFLQAKYPEIIMDNPEARYYPRQQKLFIIFVSLDTYESLSKIRGRESSGYVGFLNTIYLKTYGDNYSLRAMKTTIRHEIFHYLNNYYGLTREFEEAAAKRFGADN